MKWLRPNRLKSLMIVTFFAALIFDVVLFIRDIIINYYEQLQLLILCALALLTLSLVLYIFVIAISLPKK